MSKIAKELEASKEEKILDQIVKYQKTAKKIEERLDIWHDRIISELGNMHIFQPYLDGNLNCEKLLKRMENFLDSTTWQNMQEIEKDDLQDFITCYLNKAWTPAGIMAMCAIESSVRKYYTTLTGQTKTQWWKITDDLRKNYQADKDLVA